jgi:hypothetical protein
MVKLVALYESGDTDDTDWRNKTLFIHNWLKLLVDIIVVMERYRVQVHPYYRHFDTYDDMDPVVVSIVVVVNLKLKQIEKRL